MNNRIKNGIGLRIKMEAVGIGLNVSGSYVLRSFDPREWDRIQNTDFSTVTFGNEDHVVVARGTQGTLAKFAKVTSDRKFARYSGGKYISIALIEGEVFSKPEFIRSIAQNPTLRVSGAQERVGILHGDRNAKYKSLVYPVPGGFQILDIEETPPPQSLEMMVHIEETNPPEGKLVKEELMKLFA